MEELEKCMNDGKNFVESGDYDKAIEIWNCGLEYISQNKKLKDKKSRFIIAIGDALFNKKEYDEAINSLKAGKKVAKNGAEKMFSSLRLGQCYFEKGNEKKALKEFTNVYIYMGAKFFEKEDPKYFNLLNEKLLQNPNKNAKLVDDFWDIFYYTDMETLKRVFDICKIDATYNGLNAFAFSMSIPQMKFFIERGLDPNKDCGRGFPAIVYQCGSKSSIEFLKKYNVDLDLAMKYSKETDQLDDICNLMECGVELGNYNFNVSYWLEYGNNIDIVSIYKLAKIEIEKGLEITPKMKESVTNIGQRFEFYRDSFNKDCVDEYSDALDGLYELFDVEPVPRKVENDLKRKIVVKTQTWQQQYSELWEMLVPGSGSAISIQGELIRIVGKIVHEILDNGGVNWDDDYRKMLKAIPEYISQGLDVKNKEIIELVKKINVNSEEETLHELNKLIVKWVISNPNQIELKEIKYRR